MEGTILIGIAAPLLVLPRCQLDADDRDSDVGFPG